MGQLPQICQQNQRLKLRCRARLTALSRGGLGIHCHAVRLAMNGAP
jgi:hypothetical protein